MHDRRASGEQDGGNPTFAEYEQRNNARPVTAGKALALDGTEHAHGQSRGAGIGNRRMDSITREDIESLIAELMEKRELSPRSILAIYGDLRVLWRWGSTRTRSRTPIRAR
jgi:hypothetical protein